MRQREISTGGRPARSSSKPSIAQDALCWNVGTQRQGGYAPGEDACRSAALVKPGDEYDGR
jgi:hypothetical protein